MSRTAWLAGAAAFVSAVVGGQAAEDLEARLAAAPALAVERVCAPMRSVRGGEAMWFPNPGGKSGDLVIRHFETYVRNTHFTVLDFGSGEIHHTHLDKGAHGLGLVGPDGRGYGHGLGGILVYDPATNGFSRLPGALDVGGETRPLLVGPDGLLYGAGSRDDRVMAYRIDPRTGAFTDFGNLGPSHAPNPCWSYSMVADETHLYVVSGKLPWYLVAYNRETGAQEVLLTLDDPDGIIMTGSENGCTTASVRHSGGKPAERFWLVEGKAVARPEGNGAPPRQVKPAPQPVLPPRPQMEGELLPRPDGTVTLRFKLPESGEWIEKRFQAPTYPANVYQVAALPDGRIAGSGGNYLGLFVFDPASGAVEHSGPLPVSVPIPAWQSGRLHVTGYPRAATLAYDPAAPWSKTNPAFLGSLGNEGSGVHVAYAMEPAADGRVYFAGGWYRNGEGGGLGWWDPAERKAGGTSEGMGSYRATHLATTGNGRYVVVSTKAVRDQLKNTPPPAQGRIFVYDTAERKLRPGFDTVSGAIHCGAVAGSTGTCVVAITLDPEGPADKPWQERGSLLYAFDALDGRILWKRKVPHPIGFVVNENYDGTVGFDFRKGPDGRIWTYTGGKMKAVDPDRPWGLSYEDAALVRIDPANGDVEVAGRVGTVGRMAFQGKDLYLTGGSKYHLQGGEFLRRIKGVVP